MIYRNVSSALPELCHLVMSSGVVPSRNGDTRELTNVHITLTHPLERELDVPGRNHNPIAQIIESAWVLAGKNDVATLAHYLPRAPEFSDDGEVWRAGYGQRIRAFGHGQIDQLERTVDLLKRDPNTRRAVISLWDPHVDTHPGKDIPCNNWLHFLPRDGVLDLYVSVRSNDLMWGWSGINAYEWSVLLEVVARLSDLYVGELHFSISSLHLYERHWQKANLLAQQRGEVQTGMQPPLLVQNLEELDYRLGQFFEIEERLRTGVAPSGKIVSDDPLLGYWLSQVQSHWNTKPDAYTRRAALAREVVALHNEKSAAYGDSWRRRGELFSIIPNIARKVDRIAAGGATADENQVDTAMDLLVYLAKTRCWLVEHAGAPQMNGPASRDPNRVIEYMITQVAEEGVYDPGPVFESLIEAVERKDNQRHLLVDELLVIAARRLLKLTAR